MNSMYKGEGRWKGGGMGGGRGWTAGGGLRLPLRHKQPCCVFSRWHKVSIHRTGWDSCWLQFGTNTPSLVRPDHFFPFFFVVAATTKKNGPDCFFTFFLVVAATTKKNGPDRFFPFFFVVVATTKKDRKKRSGHTRLQHTLINIIHCLHRTYRAPLWFDRFEKATCKSILGYLAISICLVCLDSAWV